MVYTLVNDHLGLTFRVVAQGRFHCMFGYLSSKLTVFQELLRLSENCSPLGAVNFRANLTLHLVFPQFV